MNQPMANQDAHRKRVKLHQPVFVRQRDDLQTLRSSGDGSRNPVIKIGLDGEQFCVRLFETEFEEVA